jgi:hypothetical protein
VALSTRTSTLLSSSLSSELSGGAVAVASTPLTIIAASKFICYLNSDLGVTDDGGGLCSSWADQSSVGNTFTTSGASRPVIAAGADGHTKLVGDGTKRLSRMSDAFSGLTAGMHPWWYCVANFTGTAAQLSCIFEVHATGTGDGIACYHDGGGSLESRARLAGQPFPDTATWAGFDPPNDGLTLYHGRVSDTGASSESKLYENNVLMAENGFFPGDGLAFTCNDARVLDSTGSEGFRGDYYLFILLNAALSASEETGLIAWFDSEYPTIGLP